MDYIYVFCWKRNRTLSSRVTPQGARHQKTSYRRLPSPPLPMDLAAMVAGPAAECGWGRRCDGDERRCCWGGGGSCRCAATKAAPLCRGGGDDPWGADLLAEAHDWGFPKIPRSWHRCPSAATRIWRRFGLWLWPGASWIDEAGATSAKSRRLRSEAPAAVGSTWTSWFDLGMLGMCWRAASVCRLLRCSDQ
jgi:hypothetical protein